MTRHLIVLILLICAAASCAAPANDEPEPLRTGAERLLEQAHLLEGMRVGIITNHSAMVGERHLVDVLVESENIEVVALFGPEHGIRGDADAGEKITDGVDERTGLPVYSLYGDVRAPTDEMLAGLDALVFDIQDIGARFYTYISTMAVSMQAAARNDVRFVVLDRPNPLGGERIEGFVLEPGLESFVGIVSIPVTHGMTVGELALMIRGEAMLDDVAAAELHVVEMSGWTRDMLWPQTGLPWIPPSPNIPDFETALIYPGACYFEATNASEGRGTHEPFILLGAPWADGQALADALNERELPGVRFEPESFTPQSIAGMSSHPKLLGVPVQGVRHIIDDMAVVEPVSVGMHLLEVFYAQAPEEERQALLRQRWMHLLAGSERLYTMLRDGRSAQEIIASWQAELADFDRLRAQYLLY